MSTEKIPAITDIIPAPSAAETVNTYTTDTQYAPAIAGPDTSGRTLIVWASVGQDGDEEGIFGQFYSADGNKEGGEFQLNTYTTNYQRFPDVCKLDDDSWVVVWYSNGQDGSVSSVYGQKLFNDGTFNGAEFRINTYTTNAQNFARVTAINSNRFVVAWVSSGQDGSRTSIHAQRYNTAGPLGGEIAVEPGQPYSTSFPAVTRLSDGGFFIVWSAAQSAVFPFPPYSITGQRFDASGNPVGGLIAISAESINARQSDIKQLPNGDVLVVWPGGSSLNEIGIYGQRLTADGVKIGNQFKISSYRPTHFIYPFTQPRIAVGDTTILVVYRAPALSGLSNEYQVLLQLISQTGEKLGSEYKVTPSLESQSYPDAMYTNGTYTLTWSSNGVDGSATAVQRLANIPEFSIRFTDQETNQAQNYPYTENDPENPAINLGRAVVTSAANKVTLRYQCSDITVGSLQFGGALPAGVTLISYNKATGIIEVSGPPTLLDQLSNLEFVPFANANANVEISIEAAQDDDWLNAIKIPNVKHLIGTDVNNPVLRSPKLLPRRYDVDFVLNEYFEDGDGLAELNYRLFVDNNFVVEVDANGNKIEDNLAALPNPPLILVNNGTAFRVLPQREPHVYGVTATDGPTSASLDWNVPALIGLTGLSKFQKGLLLAGKVVGYGVVALTSLGIAYSPIKIWQNYTARTAFAHEIDRQLYARIDPRADFPAGVFLLLFAEPISKTIFSSGNFYQLRGGVSNREIKHLVTDLLAVFNELYHAEAPALVDIINQLLATITAEYDAGILSMSLNDSNATNETELDDSTTSLTSAESRAMQKKTKILRKAIVVALAQSELQGQVKALHTLIAAEINSVIYHDAVQGEGGWRGTLASMAKKASSWLRLKGSATSNTVQSNHTKIYQRILSKLTQYHQEQSMGADMEADGVSLQQTYALATVSFGAVPGAAVLNDQFEQNGDSNTAEKAVNYGEFGDNQNDNEETGYDHPPGHSFY